MLRTKSERQSSWHKTELQFFDEISRVLNSDMELDNMLFRDYEEDQTYD